MGWWKNGCGNSVLFPINIIFGVVSEAPSLPLFSVFPPHSFLFPDVTGTLTETSGKFLRFIDSLCLCLREFSLTDSSWISAYWWRQQGGVFKIAPFFPPGDCKLEPAIQDQLKLSVNPRSEIKRRLDADEVWRKLRGNDNLRRAAEQTWVFEVIFVMLSCGTTRVRGRFFS